MNAPALSRVVGMVLTACLMIVSSVQLRADDAASATLSYSWTGNSIDGLAVTSTDVYLYNVGTGYYMNQGGFWGTQPALRKVGTPVQIVSSFTSDLDNNTYTATSGCYFLKSGVNHVGDDNFGTDKTTEGYIGYVEGTSSSSTDFPLLYDWGRLYMDRTPVSTSWYSGTCDIGFEQVTDVSSATVYQLTVTPTSDTKYYWTAVADSGSLFINLVDEDSVKKVDEGYDQWILVTKDDLLSAFNTASASSATPADATFLISDQNFHRANSDISSWKCSTDGGSTTTTFTDGTTNALSDSQDYTFYNGMGYIDEDKATTTTTDEEGNTMSTTINNYYVRLYGQYYAANIYNAASATVTQTVSIDRAGWYRVECAGFYIEPDSSTDTDETDTDSSTEEDSNGGDTETADIDTLYVLGAEGGSWSWSTYQTLIETGSGTNIFYGEVKVLSNSSVSQAWAAFYTDISEDRRTKVSDATDDFYTAYRYGPAYSETTNGDYYVTTNTVDKAITLVNCSTAGNSTAFNFQSAATYYVTVDMSNASAMTVTFATTASSTTTSAPQRADETSTEETATSTAMTAKLFAKATDTSSLNYSGSTSLYHMGASTSDELTASDINTANGYLQGGRLLTNASTEDYYENYVYVYVSIPSGESSTTLDFGIEVANGTGGWTCFDDVELAYLGNQQEYIVLDQTDEKLSYATTTNGSTTYTSFGLNDQLANAIAYGKSESGSETDYASSMSNYVLALARPMQDGEWNSLVLPVDLTYAQLQAAFGTGMRAAKFTSVTVGEGDNQVINFTTVKFSDSQGLEHGQLYLIKPTESTLTDNPGTTGLVTPKPQDGSTSATYTRTINSQYYQIPQVAFPSDIVSTGQYEADITQEAINAMSRDGSLTMKGTYIKQTDKVPTGSYVVGQTSDGTWGFYRYTGSTSLAIKGFRTWIEPTNTQQASSLVNLSFTVDGEFDTSLSSDTQEELYSLIQTIATESPTHTATTPTANRVYSLSGQLLRNNASLDGLRQGIYIVNGKKYVVK